MDSKTKTRIRRLVKNQTVPEIAKRLGIGQQRIYRFCKREGIEIIRVTGRLPKDIETIYEKIDELGSAEAVATHYGVTRQAVYYRCAQSES